MNPGQDLNNIAETRLSYINGSSPVNRIKTKKKKKILTYLKKILHYVEHRVER